MRVPFLEAVEQRLLLGDGAMGTQLIEAGLPAGGCGAEWNLTQPERVRIIQSAYVAAGSDLLLTNTFGGCPLALARHGLADKAYPINLTAARRVALVGSRVPPIRSKKSTDAPTERHFPLTS